MPSLPTSKERPLPARLCLPGDPGTAPYVLPGAASPGSSPPNRAIPKNASNPAAVNQDSPLYLPGTQSTQQFLSTSTGIHAGGSAPATTQNATTGARPFQAPFAWLPAAQNTTAPFAVATDAAHHGQAGQAFEMAHEEMEFWMVAAPRDALPPHHEPEDAFRRRHQYPDGGLRGMPAARTSVQTGNASTGTKKRKASDAPTQGAKRSRTHEATESTAQFEALQPPAAGFTAVGFADSGPLSMLTWSDASENANASNPLGDFLPDMNYLFADAPFGGALPFANGFGAQPLLQSTSAPPAGSGQRGLMPAQSIAAEKARIGEDTASETQTPHSYPLDDLFRPEMDYLFADAPVGGALPLTNEFRAPPLVTSTSVPPAPTSAPRDLTPAQLIAAAKARLDKDAMGGDLPLLLPGTAGGSTPARAEVDAFATPSGSAAVKITPETKRRIREAEAEMLRALEIAPPKDSSPMEQRMIVCTYVDLVVFGGRPVMMSAHLDAQNNNTTLPLGQLQVGRSEYFAKQEAAKQEREAAKEARFRTTKRGRATQLVKELQYQDGQLLPFCELCNAEQPEGRLLRPYRSEDKLVNHYASKHVD